jgi:hypothetical protein
MANLWVIMTGLGTLVERPENAQAPGVFLMRQVLPESETVGGENVLPHQPKMMLTTGGVLLEVGEREIEFFPAGNGAPELDGPDRGLLLPVGEKLEEIARLNDHLLVENQLDNRARVILAGGRIEAIQVDQNYRLDKVSRNFNIHLVGLYNPATGAGERIDSRVVANGILFKRHIPSELGVPSVRIGAETFNLVKVDKENMGNLQPVNNEDNYVVWIVNVADAADLTPDSVDPNFLSPDTPAAQSALSFDRDFALLYEWLANPVSVRHVPITYRQRAANTGQGDPPGQCMTGISRV